MPVLRIQLPNAAATLVSVAPGIFTVGRCLDSSIVVDHPTVSDHHCDLTVYESGECVVRDAGSEIGTFVDGQRISVTAIRPGQTLTIGEVPVALEDDPDLAEEPPLEDTISTPGNHVLRSGAPVAEHESTSSLWSAIPGAFGYPLRLHILLTLGLTAALSATPFVLPATIGIVGTLVGVLVGLYLFMLARDILVTTAMGDDEPPPNPDPIADAEVLRERALLYLATALIAFGPWTICQRIPDFPVMGLVLLAVAGAIYFPMALLGVALVDGAGPLLPTFVFRSIARVPGDYMLVIVGFAIAFSFEAIPDRFFQPLHQSRIVGGLALAFLGGFFLYLKLVWLRLLGLMYRYNVARLAWEF